MNDVTIENKQNPLKKLLSGDYRLVDIYWAGYVLVGGIFAFIISQLETESSIIMGDSLKSVYMIFISVAVWKSASLYSGKKVWAVLAKISSFLTIFISLMTLGVWILHVI